MTSTIDPAVEPVSDVSTALATYDPGAGTQGVVVGNHVLQFQEFAKVLAVSELLPDGLRNKPANVFMALMQGLDLGLRPMQALNLIDVIKGKPAMSAQGMRAQIHAAGHRVRITEWTEERCVILGHRKDWPDDEWVEASFTIEQAKQAGLTGGDNWKKYPADMLLARATTRLAKAYFSDVTNGLSSVEELLDVAPVDRPQALATVAAQRDTTGPDVDSTGQQIIDAQVIDEVDDDEIRAAVEKLAHREDPEMSPGLTCDCGEGHAIDDCPAAQESSD